MGLFGLLFAGFLIYSAFKNTDDNANDIYTQTKSQTKTKTYSHTTHQDKRQTKLYAKQPAKKLPKIEQTRNTYTTTYNRSEHKGLYSNIKQETFSEDAEAMYEKAKELYELKDYYQAKKYIQEAIKQDPSNSLYLELNRTIRMDMNR